MPTSRGRVTLSSPNATDAPLIDPNFYGSEADRTMMRHGIRQVTKLFLDTPEGREMVESEVVPEGFKPFTLESTDAEIDERVGAVGGSFWHVAGSAAMGKVVDSELRVYGVKGLRVVDSSVLPVSIAAHYQVCIYALAEQAADLILGA